MHAEGCWYNNDKFVVRAVGCRKVVSKRARDGRVNFKWVNSIVLG